VVGIDDRYKGLLDSESTREERRMLEQFSGVDSLVIAEEALALYRLTMVVPSGSSVLEIGSYRGGSTVAIGHAAIQRDLRLFCIDKWAAYHDQSDFINFDRKHLDDMRILGEFIRNTDFIKERLCMLRGEAASFTGILGSGIFSMVFVDGAHDYFSVVDDIIFSLKVIKPGGMLCGHDYHSAGLDVKKAVHDVIISSDTITLKGLVAKTSIWYAVVEDPPYELLLAETIRLMAKSDFRGAYQHLCHGSCSVRGTEEIERLKRGLEQELSNSNQQGN